MTHIGWQYGCCNGAYDVERDWNMVVLTSPGGYRWRISLCDEYLVQLRKKLNVFMGSQ